MSTKHIPSTVSMHNFYPADAKTVEQTLQESLIYHCIDMGGFTVYHGTRDGSEIVIVEHHNQKPDELSAIWFDENE